MVYTNLYLPIATGERKNGNDHGMRCVVPMKRGYSNFEGGTL